MSQFVIATDETLYLLTVFQAMKVILCITLFFSKKSMQTFSGRNMHFSSFDESVGSHLKLTNAKQFFYRKKRRHFYHILHCILSFELKM